MRSFLGWFLLVHGAFVFCAGIGGIGGGTLVGFLFTAEQLTSADPSETRLWLMVALIGGIAGLATGHLMMLFGQSMTSSDWLPFPTRHTFLWFFLQTLRQAARSAIAGSFFAVVLIKIFAAPSAIALFPAAAGVVLLSLCLPPLSGAIKRIDEQA